MVLFHFMEQRLQKILSQMGIVSRRKAEELILDGKVLVNGKVATIGMKADPGTDYIKVSGRIVASPQQKDVRKVYLMFNKPKGVVTTLSDPQGRPTIRDFLRDVKQRVFPVGRLDYDSEGLLLLTNDGDFSNAILHPSGAIPKTYHVKVKGDIGQDELGKLRKGVRLDDGQTMPARARKMRHTENNTWVEVTIYEGRKRQVRRMFEKVGHPVLKLTRIGIAGLKLGDLKSGDIRHLTHAELQHLKKEIGT